MRELVGLPEDQIGRGAISKGRHIVPGENPAVPAVAQIKTIGHHARVHRDAVPNLIASAIEPADTASINRFATQ